METKDERAITTDDVLGRLERRGLRVTRSMLAQDVRADYLPAPTLAPRGPRQGVGRHWPQWAVWRAVYLYRLRKRGVQGDLLRMLLYLRDGWGWEQVQPLCLTGLEKALRAQGRGITSRVRRPAPTPTNLDFLADKLAADESTSPTLARFIWGMGLFGQPLPDGSLLPFFEAFRTEFGVGSAEHGRVVEQHLAHSGLTWARVLDLVRAADATQADAARRWFLASMRSFRGVYHGYLQLHGHRGQSANPLTLCGLPRVSVQETFRSLPGRPTAAQLLAAQLGVFLMFEELGLPNDGVPSDAPEGRPGASSAEAWGA